MSFKRHNIPSEFHKSSVAGTAIILAHALGMFLLPALGARLVVGAPWPLAIKVILAIPLVFLAAQGLHLLAITGHEGFHFTLHRNKTVSAAIGVVFSALTPGHLDIGFAISHWNHHRATNTEGDPDCRAFGPHRTLLGRLIFARLAATRGYLINSIKLAFNMPLPFKYKFPLKPSTVTRLAWLNIACSGLFLSAYAAIAIYDPMTGLVSIALPTLLLIPVSGVRPYLEHAGTEIGRGRNARTRTSWISTALLLGTNYHLEHHLYPSVPCYRLPKLHRYLRDNGGLENALIEPRFFRSLKNVTTRAQYPQGISAS